jgi:hypothetical protein
MIGRAGIGEGQSGLALNCALALHAGGEFCNPRKLLNNAGLLVYITQYAWYKCEC